MKKTVINIHGPICSGKTSVARVLHAKMPRTFLISGDRIKWLISDYDAPNDRELISLMVFDMTKRALDAGVNVIKDSNYMLWLKGDLAERYRDLFNEQDVELFQFNLEAPYEVLIERLKERVERSEREGKKVSVKTPEKFDKYYGDYQKMKNNEFETFDTTKFTSEEIADAILLKIQNA